MTSKGDTKGVAIVRLGARSVLGFEDGCVMCVGKWKMLGVGPV